MSGAIAMQCVWYIFDIGLGCRILTSYVECFMVADTTITDSCFFLGAARASLMNRGRLVQVVSETFIRSS